MQLPIEEIRLAFWAAWEKGNVVVTAPTGSGKSTQVPRWCGERGKVVIVEPRRVACRALAQRVAELEGATLGEEVGYWVRDEKRCSDETKLLFVTPGMALRQMPRLLDAGTIIVDELHERHLDVDLLVALLRQKSAKLVVMSATLAGEEVAAALDATLLEAKGRLFPVETKYRSGERSMPSREGLSEAVLGALKEVLAEQSGDVLVFLPGKGEIADVEGRLSRARLGEEVSVLCLHGGLSLKEQSAVFGKVSGRKVVLSTNVAETSLTVPGIGAVIDAGLVRRTSYHQGRAHLALLPVAQDAADQRAGRAGRLGPGLCVRLWAQHAALDKHTPPELHRESLVPLVLGAMVSGGLKHADEVAALPFLDAPKQHALEAAVAELEALGALDEGRPTERTAALFGMPLDAHLGRLLVQAKGEDDPALLQDCVDLVAALGVGKRLFLGPPKDQDDPFRADGCDASGLVRLMRSPERSPALREARLGAKRLRKALELGEPEHETVDADALRAVALRSDPRSAHVVRRRGNKRGVRISLAAGSTELDLGRESAAWLKLNPEPGQAPAEAVVVFEHRAFGVGRERKLRATCASPLSMHELRVFGLGEPRVGGVRVEGRGERRRIVATVEMVLAKKVISTDEKVPEGEAARQALLVLLLEGRLFRQALAETKERIAAWDLAEQLQRSTVGKAVGLREVPKAPALDVWLRKQIDALGFERGDELGLLSGDDFQIDGLAYEHQAIVDEHFPSRIEVGGATYAAEYEVAQRRVLLKLVKGQRKEPPPRSWLPRFGGLKIFIEAGRRLHEVR